MADLAVGAGKATAGAIAMRILHAVESYFPSVSGAPEVVRHLSERMVKLGHDVTVATRKLSERRSLNHNDVKIIEFDIQPTSDRGMSIVTGLSGETNKYQDFLRAGKFDIVMSYAAQQWTTDLMFDVLDEIKAKKVLVPCGYSALHDPLYKGYFEKLPDYLRKFDATVYLSRTYQDISFAREHGIHNIHIIPNGADEKIFRKSLSQKQKSALRKQFGIDGLMIMTIANYTGEKGHDELLHVFKRLPVRKATLVSAGGITPGIGCYDMFKQQAERINQSQKFIGKKVVMIDGTKRQQVYDLLRCADLFVFLSNIEASPLVLFEAAAAGVPFVASTAGNSVEIAQWTSGGVNVKSRAMPNGRVKANLGHALWQTSRLVHSSKMRKRLGELGRQSWKKHYTWDKITHQYLKLYEDLLSAEKAK